MNVSDGRSQDGQIGRLFLIGRDWQLLFERFKTFFEVRPAILLQLVVHFTRPCPNS